MRLQSRKRVIRVAPLVAALTIQVCSGSVCLGQPQSANAAGTPLGRALQNTVDTGVPTLAVISSRTNPGSQQALLTLLRSPEAAALVRTMQFSELPAELYPNHVKTLGVRTFPTYIAFRRGKSGIEVAGAKAELTNPREVFDWVGSLSLRETAPTQADEKATADTALAQVGHHATASEQAYPSEQAPPVLSPPPPKQPVMSPPPPVYSPPQQQMMYAPQPYVAPLPAPAPVYLQTPSPTMIVQQQPQQILIAPPSPPQVTVAMAPSAAPMVSYAPQPAPAAAPQPNIFTQPAQTPQPAQAPQPAPAPVQYAPAPQPVYYAQAPLAVPAPQPAPAPVAQGPVASAALTMVLTNPNLLNRILGTIGEHFAEKKNPRIAMSPTPALAPTSIGMAPMGQAPVAQAPAQAPTGYAPVGYSPVTAYAPAGPPMMAVTPESTSFAPCNTFSAPCRYHGGPCPGAGGNYAPPAPPYPAASPQGGHAHQAPGKSLFSRMMHK